MPKKLYVRKLDVVISFVVSTAIDIVAINYFDTFTIKFICCTHIAANFISMYWMHKNFNRKNLITKSIIDLLFYPFLSAYAYFVCQDDKLFFGAIIIFLINIIANLVHYDNNAKHRNFNIIANIVYTIVFIAYAFVINIELTYHYYLLIVLAGVIFSVSTSTSNAISDYISIIKTKGREFDAIELVQRNVKHDLNNDFENFNIIKIGLETLKKRYPSMVDNQSYKMLDDALNIVSTVAPRKVKLLGEHGIGDFQVFTIVDRIVVEGSFKRFTSIDIPKCDPLYHHCVYFSQMIFNFLTNSKEAYDRLKVTNAPLHIKLSYESDSRELVYTDNAGGFDVNKISKGISLKQGDGHGFFLQGLIKDQDKSNLKIKCERTEVGIRYEIKFLDPDRMSK